MINVNISNLPNHNLLTLKVSGHAGQDIKGKDIVCSAVSCLAYTLVNVVSNDDYFGIKGVSENGLMDVTITAQKGHYDRLMDYIYVIQIGFMALEKTYPEYIKLNSIISFDEYGKISDS